MRIRKCRICKNEIDQLISLGKMPIVNYFLSKEEVDGKREKKYSLNLALCSNCGLVQLDEIVNPKKIFITYHYLSSASSPLKKHLEDLADSSRLRFNLNENSSVLDIGCNDGIFLSVLRKYGIKTLGIDPAKNIASRIRGSGLKIISDFFSKELSDKIKKKYNKFDLIVTTNTLAQVPDLHNFIKGIKNVLSEHGVFIIEVGYVLDMVKKKTFDAIYHEHFSYFSLLPLIELFSKNGLEIFDAQRIDNHGGSLRVFAKHKEDKTKKILNGVGKILNNEKKYRLKETFFYKGFIKYIKDFRKILTKKLILIKKNNKKIVGFGAPAKGVILLNYCNINISILDYIVDSTPYKQNRFVPGVHIPIFSEETINNKIVPDYFLILAWNYKDKILEKLRPYIKKGSKVIMPFPRIEVI